MTPAPTGTGLEAPSSPSPAAERSDPNDHMALTLRTLLEAAGVEAAVSGDPPIAGLAYDSRRVSPGSLFCCIPGERSDGHDHAADALAAGAAALLVERVLPLDAPQARVEHVRPILGHVASAFHAHPSRSMAVAGITGTNGKTTVTYLVEAMATAAGLAAGVLGTVEARVGAETVPSSRTTPESVDLQATLARMRDAGAETVAMEVTSHGLHQHRVAGTRFACAAFTNLTQDHLDYHGTLDAYFEAKALLFDPSYTERAVVNTADERGRMLAERASDLSVLTYAGADADITATQLRSEATGTRFRIRTPEGDADLETALVGGYNVQNVLCAAGVALQLGWGLDAIVSGARDLRAVPGRLERVDAGQGFAVLVDYAHTPDAVERALEAAKALTSGRLICVIGCGGDRDRAKRPLMGEAAARVADLAVITSDNPRSEDPMAIIEDILPGVERGGGAHVVLPDRREAIEHAVAEARDGDVVVIAGKGHEQGQTFADRTVPFDDRTVAREAIEARCRS